MSKAFFWRIIAVVILVIGGSVIMNIAKTALPDGVSIQPSVNPSHVDDFVKATNEHSDTARLFFSADMAFSIGYMILFAGIFTVLRQHQPLFAWFGLGFAILAGGCDLIENSIYLSYALRAWHDVALTDPAILLLSVLTTLKWVGIVGVFIAYCLAFPLETMTGKLSVLTMALVPLVVLGGYAFDVLMAYRNLVFIVPLPFVLYYLWQQTEIGEIEIDGKAA